MDLDIERIASEQAPTVARALGHAAGRGGTEADFRREAARILEEAGRAAGLTIVPRDEFSVARGRVDSVYNRLIIEYKRPGVLRDSKGAAANQAAIQQVKDYILDVAKRERRESQRLAGVATDGHYFLFVRRIGEGWSVDDPVPVGAASTEHLLRLLFSLSTGAALVPENLIEDFGPRTLRAQRAVRALSAALHANQHPLVARLFEQWKLFYSEATDYRQWAEGIGRREEYRSFVKGMGLDPKCAEPAEVFFCLHTYYALLIKLVASLAAARFAGGAPAPLSQMAAKQGEALCQAFVNLERGGLFREYGIRNFLEGDFFGWYLAAWNQDIEEAVGRLVQRLGEYDPGTLELAPENARDLLKKLYHYLLPREIRHGLGEYYTPDWLAERLIRQTLGEADLGNARKRVLDPSCGSGTFLVILIKHIRERAQRNRLQPAETLELILQNVIGIDINPLAVIAARTNYLLALGDLLKGRKDEIDIPVYQADSVLTPARGSDLFDGDVYPLKTSVGVFRIPAIFSERSRMDVLTRELDDAVEAGSGEAAFCARIARAGVLDSQEMEAAEGRLKALYSQLRALHEQGLNGVWARIIRNAFAPLFLEPCDYVVGNPPWVNWESLPDDYRRETRPLWEHYGLFPHGGMDTILGKGKKDIAMLMTYVAADRYLKRGGKLGFVLSQSLFKTSGAGQGFRRFALPDKTPFGPLVVEDMVQLKPFEGATNRTAVAVFAKGHKVRYPVPYQYWVKRGEGRSGSIPFDMPYEEVKERLSYRQWEGEPVSGKDDTTAWITAKPVALRALRKVLGKSAYSAHAGSYTGGTNAIFWVEITGQRPGGLSIVANITEGARVSVPSTQAAVETALLYPLLRGRDVQRWRAAPSAHILMTQDPMARRGIDVETMRMQYPKAHAYLKRFEDVLRARRDRGTRGLLDKGAPFWSIFSVADYTFAPWKVVWREVADELQAAVVHSSEVGGELKSVVPDHTCILVALENPAEAHYLCAVLNSSPARLAIRNYIVLHPDPHVLDNLSVPKFSPSQAVHHKLAALSKRAHTVASAGDHAGLNQVEGEIDDWVAKLWSLSTEELADIRRSLEEM